MGQSDTNRGLKRGHLFFFGLITTIGKAGEGLKSLRSDGFNPFIYGIQNISLFICLFGTAFANYLIE